VKKRIKLTFVEEGVSAIAELLEDKAPKTCEMVWNALEEPLEGKVIHAMWTGRELSFTPPAGRFPEDAWKLPPENQTAFPIPGDLIWNGYAPYQWQGAPHQVLDLGIFYGRDSRILLPVGWRAGNLFGTIVENLEEFAKVAARCQSEGVKQIRISRMP